jgi:hypothetical protein
MRGWRAKKPHKFATFWPLPRQILPEQMLAGHRVSRQFQVSDLRLGLHGLGVSAL